MWLELMQVHVERVMASVASDCVDLGAFGSKDGETMAWWLAALMLDLPQLHSVYFAGCTIS